MLARVFSDEEFDRERAAKENSVEVCGVLALLVFPASAGFSVVAGV